MPTLICANEAEERAALDTLRAVRQKFDNSITADTRWVCFNGLSFDGPVLETRARLLGAKPFLLDLRKYGSRNICDLYAELTFNGECGMAVMSRTQKALAARLGISVQDDCDGSQVAALVAAGDYYAVAAHCQSDVDTLAAMYRRIYPNRPGFVFDLETVPVDNAAEYRAFVKPDGRLTDEKKIAADIDAKLGKAGLDPWLCRIVCIGYEMV
jgi:hypothetical protein